MFPGRLRRFHLEMDDKIFLGVIGGVIVFAIAQSVLHLSSYYSFFLSKICAFAILSLAFNLLYGHTGLLSFGHGGFFLVGAYAGALTLEFTGGNVYLGFIVCIAASALFALVVGSLAVRLRGIYFAILTLAFSMLPYFLIRDTFRALTGGTMGWNFSVLPPFFFDLGNPFLLLLFTLGILIVVYIILRKIISSNFGQCLKCIRDNELKLQGLGYNTKRLMRNAVTISGSLGGLSGYL